MLQQAIGKYRWTICSLLFVATTVNYLDRQVLSLLQPYLAERFKWTNSDYANITAVFQFVYAFAMLFAGRIIDKLGTKKGYAPFFCLDAIIKKGPCPFFGMRQAKRLLGLTFSCESEARSRSGQGTKCSRGTAATASRTRSSAT